MLLFVGLSRASEVTLHWDDNIDADFYEVYQRTSNTDFYYLKDAATNETVITDLRSDTIYYFGVKGVNICGASVMSDETRVYIDELLCKGEPNLPKTTGCYVDSVVK